MRAHRTEFPEFGMTMVVRPDGTVDYVRWDEAGESDSPDWFRADESESLSDETG